MSKDDSLKDILKELMSSVSNINGAAIVSVEGLPIESVLENDVDETRIAAMTAAILSLGERASQELDKGMLEQIYIRGEKGYILTMAAGQNAVLTLSTDKEIRLGLIFLECKRACEKIAKII
ncbi:MAG: roadblock/LC7 domain-containing protein [Promethearchaeota archaeon]